jgi:amino acid adenylation domain-containing protein/non-ribosomal peptide synthase protein (TIGR01720 family)
MNDGSAEARLLSLIQNTGSQHLPRREGTGPAPLSWAQQGLWLLDQLEPGRADYVVPIALELCGPADEQALEQALSGLAERHEVLRTRFPAGPDGQPVQVADLPVRVTVPVEDLSGFTSEAVTARVNALAGTGFDLAAGPLWRAVLLHTGPERATLVICLHHIIFDGWSETIVARDLADLYAAAAAGRTTGRPAPSMSYADYACWQRDRLSGPVLAGNLEYWRERLAGLVPLDLPADRPRGSGRRPGGDAVPVIVDAATVTVLRDIARQARASLFMAVQAAFVALLSRYTGQDDIAIGTPVAGRNHAETEDLVGLFVNSVVLRTDTSGDPSFATLVERARDTALGAFDHQDVPFEKLVEDLAPARDLSRNPLFQVMLVLQSAGENQPWHLPGLDVRPAPVRGGLAKFDLNLTLRETPDGGLAGYLDYPVDLYDRETIERLAGHLRVLLAGFAAGPQVPVSQVEMMPAAERDVVVREWNDTAGPWPSTQTIDGLVRARAASCPDATAVICGDQKVSFSGLMADADRLAGLLRDDYGAGPGTLIGVFVERGPDMVTALLAVLIAGAAYVPLDPEYPAGRLEFMLADSAAPLVITQSCLASRLPQGPDGPALLVRDEDRVRDELAARPAGPPVPLAGPGDLAYVIYTSGSTGRPKGVMVEHGGVVNYLAWCDEAYPADRSADAGTLLYSPAAFDLTVTAQFLPLIQGLPIAIPWAGPGETAFSAAVDALLAGTRVSFLKMTPSHAELLAASADAVGTPLHVATMVLGGEELTAALARKVLAACPGTVIYNEYGATEGSVANVMSATRAVPEDAAGGITAGRAITNTTCYVVDRDGRPVPAGVPGEALLGGTCVARGYLGRPDLTAARFVTTTALDGNPRRVYRTGDLCRWLPGGYLEFLGRMDTQVKLRGYRIELGEIENTLTAHPAIAAAAVVVREDTPGVRRLAAYTVPAPGTPPPGPAELAAHAAATLPAYMIPAVWTTLPRLPLTPNGKTDRDALPTPPATASTKTPTPPATPAQRAIAAIWQHILGTPRPGIHDNFFEHGGHSLLAAQFTARVRAELGLELPLRALFQAPTIAELSELLPSLAAAATDGPRPRPRSGSEPVPLSWAQQGLWILDQLEPGRSDYVVPIALELSGPVDARCLEQALSGLAARHEVLRTRFPAGPDGQPMQIADLPAQITLPVEDLAGPAEDPAVPAGDAAATRMDALAGPGFDLAAGPLWRAALLRIGSERAILVICLHHIIFDGWSEAIFARELAALYCAAIADGEPAGLPDLPVTYADYAIWQRDRMSGPVLDSHLAYWRERLAGLTPLNLPADHPRQPGCLSGDVIPVTIDADIVAALRGLAGKTRASLFMAVQAGLAALLARYCGQDDITIGTPVAGRGHTETENLLGLFVNSVVLRTDISGDPSFAMLLEQARDTALGAYDHQDLPFEKLVEDLAPGRDPGRNPLFQVMLVLQTAGETQPWNLSGLHVRPVPVQGGLAKFDLNLTLSETGDGALAGGLDYPAALFDRGTVERLAGHLRTLLAGFAANPELPLSQVEMLTPAERRLLAAWGAAATIPVEVRGAPPAPAAVRVVDSRGALVPAGLPGELLLDRGAGVPAAAAGPRRTGDLVRWSASGELEYLGRTEDHAIWRGNRIALAEVEAALAAHPAVAEAAAALRGPDLVAYLVPDGPEPPDPRDLEQFLADRLPAFTRPSAYLPLPRLPRTGDGTVDRPALPEPAARTAPVPPPHSAAEKIIAGIWREVLDLDEVSVTDNFFALGGDSIISLQVIARARQAGLRLTPKMFFQHQTVAAIAAHAQAASPHLADQAKITGEVPLTPIQHWFFELDPAEPAHFNQAELLETEGLDPVVLERALRALAEHHDALRLRAVRDGGRWRLRIDGDVGPGILTRHDLSAAGHDQLRERLSGIADDVQGHLDLARGPVIRAALIELGPGRGQRLLLVVHHLAVDGVSWRILLEDLGTACQQAAAGREPSLPAKTSSVRTWADRLTRYAAADALAELGYWAGQETPRPLPRDHGGANALSSAAAVTVELTEDETTALLQEVPQAFHTQINDALLAALGAAVHAWTGDDAVGISLEGHGREDLFADLDTSRTVGWFTSVFPVTVHGAAQADPVILLKDVSEQLRGLPRHGIGYGILRYLGDAPTRQALARPAPEINFNYLGQFAAEVTGIGRHAGLDEPRGQSVSLAGPRRHLLDILAAVEGGRLGIALSYSAAIHDRSTIERLAGDMTGCLRALIATASEQREGLGRPAHLPLADLDESELAAIMERFSS